MFGNDFLGLSSTISPFTDTQPDDVLKTKSALAQTGHYEVPDFGITPYPDTPMIEGIKKFQQDNGLKVDGVMKPQGPTETALGQRITTSAKPKATKLDPLTGLPKQEAPKLKMPTAKQWEQVAEIQKPKTAILPEGETVDQRIQSMMKDQRYQDKVDTRLRDHVQKQFQKAYQGNVQYDETGKMKQPRAVIAPDEVEPFDPDGELGKSLRHATQEVESKKPTSDDEAPEDNEGVDCGSLKQDMDDAYSDWKEADKNASQELRDLQGYVEDADNAWDDFVDALINGRVSSSDIPQAPHISKRNTDFSFFEKLLNRAAKLYKFIVHIDEASTAYAKYSRTLKPVNETRENWLKFDQEARRQRRNYDELKRKYRRNCSK